MKATEVHDAGHGCRSCGIRHGGGNVVVGLLERPTRHHGVDEVVENVNVAHGVGDGIRVLRVASDDLDAIAPREGGDALRMAGKHPHAISGVQKPRNKSSAEISGGTEHERARLLAVGTG